MNNDELKPIFNKILSKNVLPYLETFGYKKQGNNFKYYGYLLDAGSCFLIVCMCDRLSYGLD
jgi:hypothetical protein